MLKVNNTKKNFKQSKWTDCNEKADFDHNNHIHTYAVKQSTIIIQKSIHNTITLLHIDASTVLLDNHKTTFVNKHIIVYKFTNKTIKR